MSFNRLPALEAQPTTTRRHDDPQYQDDPEFAQLTERLSSRLFELTSNVARLSQQISLLGTKRDTERVRERVHDLLDETRQGFKEVGDGIKKVQAWEDLNPSQKYTAQKLSREFGSAGQEFQVIQRRALEKDRASKAALQDNSLPPTSDETSPQQQQQQQEREQQQQLHSPTLASQSAVDFQESLIIERESEIRNIEAGVSELNELFRDVATIVREQGDMIDSIDVNVENVRNETRGADVELRQASRYQKKARNKACFLLVVLAVILLVVVLAITLS